MNDEVQRHPSQEECKVMFDAGVQSVFNLLEMTKGYLPSVNMTKIILWGTFAGSAEEKKFALDMFEAWCKKEIQ